MLGENQMKKIFIFIIVGVILAIGNSFAYDKIEIEGIENLGMGGAGTAVYGRYAPLYNPALISLKSGFHMRLVEIPISISNDVLKFYQFYDKNKDDLMNFTDDSVSIARRKELLNDITKTVSKYRVRFKLGVANPNLSVGPFPFFGQGNLWWGAGLYNSVDVGARLYSGIFVPKINAWARVDAVLAVPFAYRFNRIPFVKIPGELTAGVNIKYIMRSRYEKNMNVLEFENLELQTEDLEPGRGYGLDLGFLYGFNEKLRFSLVMKDLFSTRLSYNDGSSEVLLGQTHIGAAYKLNKMFSFTGDLRDIKLDDIGKSTLFTKLYMGGEMNLLSVLKLRGGFYQGYPSFGCGLLGFLNYAFYGRELSTMPGLMPEWNHVISLSLGF
jgi:hypothetical protein